MNPAAPNRNSPARVYPPYGLPGENAARNFNMSTLAAFRGELVTAKRLWLQTLSQQSLAKPALRSTAERHWVRSHLCLCFVCGTACCCVCECAGHLSP